MNGLRLLTKGHTIRGLQEHDRAYKLADKGVLPNFSSPKRPTPNAETENTQPALIGLTPVKVETPEAEADPAKEQPAKLGLLRGLASRARGWVLRRIPWRKGSQFGSAAVQAELGLEKVKVIRNDLSEDDLEVVAMEKKTDPKQEGEKMTANP